MKVEDVVPVLWTGNVGDKEYRICGDSSLCYIERHKKFDSWCSDLDDNECERVYEAAFIDTLNKLQATQNQSESRGRALLERNK